MVFLAVQPFSLLVALHSHHVVKFIWARDAVDDLKDADFTRLALTVPQFQLLRMHIRAGDIVLMHGNLVHAGDRGTAGDFAFRCHWNLQEAKLGQQFGVEGDTFPLPIFGMRMARLLGFPAGRETEREAVSPVPKAGEEAGPSAGQ